MINSRRRRRVQWKQGVTPGYIYEFDASRCNGGISPGINSPLTTTAFDTSGHGNHGTLMYFAGTEISGYAGSGTVADPRRLVFDGASDYVSLPDLGAAEDKSFTYDACFRTSMPTNNAVLIAEGNTGNNNPTTGILIYAVTGRLSFNCRNTEGIMFSVSPAANLADDAVHHVCATCSGTALATYVDGSPSDTGTWEEGACALDTACLGALQRIALSSYFPGSILIARVYPFALTPAQVAQNYAAGPLWTGPLGVPVLGGSPFILGGAS